MHKPISQQKKQKQQQQHLGLRAYPEQPLSSVNLDKTNMQCGTLLAQCLMQPSALKAIS